MTLPVSVPSSRYGVMSTRVPPVLDVLARTAASVVTPHQLVLASITAELLVLLRTADCVLPARKLPVTEPLEALLNRMP